MKRQYEPNDGLFAMLDDAVICTIFEFVVGGTIGSDYRRFSHLVRLANTCQRLRAVAQSPTARRFAWSLIDPGTLVDERVLARGVSAAPTESDLISALATLTGPCASVSKLIPDLGNFVGTAAFGSARSLTSKGMGATGSVWQRLAEASSESLTYLDVHTIDRELELSCILSLPALRTLHIGLFHVFKLCSQGRTASGLVELHTNVPIDAASVFSENRFPNVKKLEIYSTFPAEMAIAVRACPGVESLRVAKVLYGDRALDGELCEAVGELKSLVELSLGCLGFIPWVGKLVTRALPRLRSLELFGDAGFDGPMPPSVDWSAATPSLTRLRLTDFTLNAEDIRPIMSLNGLKELALASPVRGAMEQFDNTEGLDSLVDLEVGSVDFDPLALPFCHRLRRLSLANLNIPLTVPSDVGSSLREFRCSDILDPLLSTLGILCFCHNLAVFHLRGSSLFEENEPAWWRVHAAHPIDVELIANVGRISTWLICTISPRILKLVVGLSGYTLAPRAVAIAIAKQCPSLREIQMLKVPWDSVDSWGELIDGPNGQFVFRQSGI